MSDDIKNSQAADLQAENPLGYKPVGHLLRQFAIPSIIAMLVGALYNIVDQFFIGQSIGELGNAATNVAFPINTVCTALALLFGVGAASAFNLAMGRGDRNRALYYIGNAGVLLFGSGVLLFVITELFLDPLLIAFGSPDAVLPYAREYVRITAFGFPFLLLSNGGAHLVRADGSPRFSMISNLTGAVINTILDPILIFGLDMGMQGAAIATVAGQIVSGILVFRYLCRYKAGPLEKKHVIPTINVGSYIAKLGMASFFNQMAMMVVQIVLNNSLTHYGAQSIYGESIPLAVAGIVNKFSFMFFAICIGITQGMQPISSFNYGAKKYGRVKKVVLVALGCTSVICCVAWILFQTIPRQIVGIFGGGSEMYFEFAERYFRIYMLFVFISNIQATSSTFFTSIGMPMKGAFLSLTRQIIFLLPLLIILPRFFGIDGIIYAAPIADITAYIIAGIMLVKELRRISRLEKETEMK